MTEQVPLEAKCTAADAGRLVAGKYQVIAEIARGGCGRVFKVRQAVTGKLFAVKVVPPGSAGDSALKRLRREAQILGQLHHPNLVTVYSADFDEHQGFIIVMDLLAGRSLNNIIAEQGRLPVETVVKFGAQICDGLQFAHEQGIVHRDLKPSNVMIVGTGEQRHVVLIDFGIAKMQDADQRLTRTGAILGTPLYMPPEQFRGMPLDARSDIFSLGCVLYQSATGRLPYEGDSVLEIAGKQGSHRPVAPSAINSQVSHELSDLILRCIALEPRQRYQSAADVKAALASCNLDVRASQRRHFARVMVPAIVASATAFALAAGLAYVVTHYPRHANRTVAQPRKLVTLSMYMPVSAEQNRIGELTDANQLNEALTSQNKLLADEKFWSLPANAFKRPIAYHARARIYRMLGRYFEAAADLHSARSCVDGGHLLPDVLPEEPFVTMRNGNYDAAIKQFDQLIGGPEITELRPECFEARAECYLFRGAVGQEGVEASDAAVSTRDSGFSNNITWNVITKLTRAEAKLVNGNVASAGDDLDALSRSICAFAPAGTLDAYRYWQAKTETAVKLGDKINAARYKSFWHRLDAEADQLPYVNEDQKRQNALWVKYLRERMATLNL